MPKSLKEINRDYRRGSRGFLTRRFLEMKVEASRLGIEIMSRNRFGNWSRENEGFRYSFYDYEESGFDKRLSPVIERIDRAKGFTENNLKWIFQKDKNRSHGQPIQLVDDGGKKFYPSARRAEIELGYPKGVLSRALRTGKRYKKLKVISS